MNLSLCAVTAGKPYAARCLAQLREWANVLQSELVIAGDKAAGYALAQQYGDVAIPVDIANGLGESVIPLLAKHAHGDWMFRLDDDELGTPAVLDWLRRDEWWQVNQAAYHFPRAHVWGDEQHFITDAPLWTDKQARLMKRDLMFLWANHVHAGGPVTTESADTACAILHYKFLVRSFAERQETARLYDALEPGAGSGEYFGKFTLPELFYVSGVHVREIGDGAVGLGEWIGTGEVVPCSRRIGTVTMPIGKGAWRGFENSRVGG